MAGSSPIIDATPGVVAGTFDATDLRNNFLGNALPGLLTTSDFTVAARGTPAMAVTIGIGQAVVSPGAATQQGSYLVRSGLTYTASGTTSYDTLTQGGITITSGGTDFISLLCIEVNDTDQAGAYTGFKFRIVDGTPSASATHPLEAAYWPAVPTGLLPIAAIRVRASTSSILSTDIVNLLPISPAWQRAMSLSTATVETTTSATYARLTTPDFVFAYLPSGGCPRIFHEGLWKISVAAGTQKAALFINGTQLKTRPHQNGAPAVQEISSPIAAFLSGIGTSAPSGMVGSIGITADVSEVSTGMLTNIAASTAASPIEIVGLAAGWYVFEIKYQTSANTLTVQNRRMRAEVVG